MTEQTQTCTKCKTVRKLKYFSKKSSRPVGVRSKCKFCDADAYLAKKQAKAAACGQGGA